MHRERSWKILIKSWTRKRATGTLNSICWISKQTTRGPARSLHRVARVIPRSWTHYQKTFRRGPPHSNCSPTFNATTEPRLLSENCCRLWWRKRKKTIKSTYDGLSWIERPTTLFTLATSCNGYLIINSSDFIIVYAARVSFSMTKLTWTVNDLIGTDTTGHAIKIATTSVLACNSRRELRQVGVNSRRLVFAVIGIYFGKQLREFESRCRGTNIKFSNSLLSSTCTTNPLNWPSSIIVNEWSVRFQIRRTNWKFFCALHFGFVCYQVSVKGSRRLKIHSAL